MLLSIGGNNGVPAFFDCAHERKVHHIQHLANNVTTFSPILRYALRAAYNGGASEKPYCPPLCLAGPAWV